MCVCACTWVQLLWEARRGSQVPWSCIWRRMWDTLHGAGRPGSWDPHWNPLLEQCVSHLSILPDGFSKSLIHSMGRSIPLHILCIQTQQLLSITEEVRERKQRLVFSFLKHEKALRTQASVCWSIHPPVNIFSLFVFFFLMERKVWPESDFYYTEWNDSIYLRSQNSNQTRDNSSCSP